MKNVFKLLGIIALIAVIGFSACDNGGGDGTPSINTTALNDVILDAGIARDGVITANSASDVPEGKKWVTQNEWNAFDTAYKTAAETKTNPSSQSAVDTAKTNLQAALATFNAAKKNGSGSAIKLSGTITVKNNGQIVPYVVLSANTNDWSWSANTKVHLKDESTQWEIITKPFSSSTEISFRISSYDNDKYENKIFETTVDGLKRQVFNTDIGNITINETLNLITISGTLKLGNNGQAIPSVAIEAFKKGDNDNILGSVKIINAVNNIPWSIMIPPQAVDTDITFSVVGFDGPLVWEYEQLFACWQHDFGVKVGSQNKTGIVLNFITISGTLNLDYNGQTIPSVFIRIQRKDGADGDGDSGRTHILNAGKNTPWSIIMLPQTVDTDVVFTIVGLPGPNLPSEWWDSKEHLFALWEKDFGVKVGNQSKSGIAFNLITISGTVNVTYKGSRVPIVEFHVHIKDGDDYGEWVAGTELHSPSANAPWSIVIPAYTSDKVINISIGGNNEDGVWLFGSDDTTRTVKNTNVSGIAFNFIELSGTVNVTYKGNRVPIVTVTVQNSDWEWITGTDLHNPSANAPWSIIIPAYTSDTEIRIGIVCKDENAADLKGLWGMETRTVKNTSVSGIVLDVGNITN